MSVHCKTVRDEGYKIWKGDVRSLIGLTTALWSFIGKRISLTT